MFLLFFFSFFLLIPSFDQNCPDVSLSYRTTQAPFKEILGKSTISFHQSSPTTINLTSPLTNYRNTPEIFVLNITFPFNKSSNNKRKSTKSTFSKSTFKKYIYDYFVTILVLSGDIESNPGPTRYEEFTEKLDKVIALKNSTCQIFSREDINKKISSLLVSRPIETNEIEKWAIIQKNYNLVSYQGTHILYRKEKGDLPAKRVIAIEEIFETLDKIHQSEGKHFGRTKLYKNVAQQYYGITEKICGLYVSRLVI